MKLSSAAGTGLGNWVKASGAEEESISQVRWRGAGSPRPS